MITVLLISPLCSRKVYRTSIPEELRSGQAMQKFSRLLARGLCENGAAVRVLSAPPIRRLSGRRTYRPESDEEDGVAFDYLMTVWPQAVGRIVRVCETVRRVTRAARTDVDVVLADPMNVLTFLAARVATRLSTTPLVAVMTDVPTYYAGSVGRKKSLPLRVSELLMSRADAYLLLTPQMDSLVNPHGRPAVVVEGMAQVDDSPDGLEPPIDRSRKIMLYAGGIRRAYGLERLLSAFAEVGNAGWEFHVYGGGSFADQFASLCEGVAGVYYLGVKDNDVVVREQKRASLLVNPRLSDHEYTHYSFPSKIVEYMASGVPTLTTRLPGIPGDYFTHLLVFDDESTVGMERTLSRVFAMAEPERQAIGLRAQDWIRESKSARVQSRIVLEMLNGLTNVRARRVTSSEQ